MEFVVPIKGERARARREAAQRRDEDREEDEEAGSDEDLAGALLRDVLRGDLTWVIAAAARASAKVRAGGRAPRALDARMRIQRRGQRGGCGRCRCGDAGLRCQRRAWSRGGGVRSQA